LAILRNAGIVTDDKRGLQVYYTLQVPCILNSLECVEQVLKSKIENQLAMMQ